LATGYLAGASAQTADVRPAEGRPDVEQLKTAFSRFPAGVVVVTSAFPGGEFVGATVSSFTSLSFTPPLVALGLAEQSKTLSAILERGHFAVHIVAEPQCQVAMHFASKSADKFDTMPHEVSRYGVPLLTAFESRLECVLDCAHPAGDHQLLIGRIHEIVIGEQDTSAVVWFQRGFRLVDPTSAT
jgi:3-hydroxy-9,10-secoandrosta-1,3,5(10)-triene-9,17-dione monooxygenase reductase component